MDLSEASDTHECRCPPVQLAASGDAAVLTDRELHALLKDRRLRIRVASGGVAVLSFDGDGTVAGEFPDGSRDRGSWWLEGDRYCIDWERGPKTSCTHVHRGGATLILRDPAGATRGWVEATDDATAR